MKRVRWKLMSKNFLNIVFNDLNLLKSSSTWNLDILNKKFAKIKAERKV